MGTAPSYGKEGKQGGGDGIHHVIGKDIGGMPHEEWGRALGRDEWEGPGEEWRALWHEW